MVKARAGCEVTLIVPARSNHPVTDFARRYYLRELQRAGVRVRLHDPGMMHSKAMVVDDRIGLLSHCRQSRLLHQRKTRFIGNAAEELSRLPAPLL
jgi:hypothetical protein